MGSPLLKYIPVPFFDDAIKIVQMRWGDLQGLEVDLMSRRTNRTCSVRFESTFGIRMLDELDLASWWIDGNREKPAKSWLYEVTTGGWFDFESTRTDFYSQHQAKGNEYLIVGYDEVISVLSRENPVVVAQPSDA